MKKRKGYSFYFVTPQNPGVWFDMTPGIKDLSRTRTSLNQYVPLPNGAVYRGLNGEGLGSIQLSGTFGMRARQFNGASLTGTEVLQLLEKLIEEYWEATGSKDTLKAQKAVVEWHDWEDDHHLYCEPGNMSWTRGSSNKIHRIYSLPLETYGKVQRKISGQILDKRTKADQYLKSMKAAQEKLQTAGRTLRKQQEKVLSYIDKYVSKPLDGIIRATEDFVAGVAAWIDVPFRVLVDLGNNINNAISSITERVLEPVINLAMRLRQLGRIVDRMAATPELLKATFEQAGSEFASFMYTNPSENDSDVQREEITSGFNSERIRRAIKAAQVSARGARKGRVLSGDTLQVIASRELGDVSRWLEISILNGYLDNDGLSGLTEILIPSQGEGGALVNQQLASTSFLSLDERLYGKDLQTIVTSRGKLSVVFENNDLRTVAGKKNLLQAVRHMDHIQQGTLLENPLYGIRARVGSSQSVNGAPELAWSLQETAQSDPRIERCDVNVTVDGNVTRYERTIFPVGGTASIPAGSITGGV